jgi:hypothetical protein
MYSFSLPDTSGQTTAWNFCALFNPEDSGVVLVLHSIQVIPYAAGEATSTTATRVNRITTSSDGTLQNASAINKFQTSYPDSASEVRTMNPSVTLGAEVGRYAPPVQGSTVTGFSGTQQEMQIMRDWGLFTLDEGEGIVFRQAGGGDTDHRYNFILVWGEQAK